MRVLRPLAFLTVAVFAISLNAGCARHESSFEFDPSTGRCIDGFGNTGLNQNSAGPCSDFRHLNLADLNFSGLDLRGSDFSYSHLSGVDFRNSDLSAAVFVRAELLDVDFTGATLVNVKPVSLELGGLSGERRLTQAPAE